MPDPRSVYHFDHDHGRAPRELAGLLGGKGAGLAEMTSVLRLPVPPGFTITTEACRAFLAGGSIEQLDAEVATALDHLAGLMGRRFGDPDDPLLVSVRSGAAMSMPGMMDTVLDIGLSARSVEGLAARTDRRFAYDAYRRLIAQYAVVVLELPGDAFERRLERARRDARVDGDGDLPVAELEAVAGDFEALVLEGSGAPFPQDPSVQLRGAIAAVFRSWNAPRAVAYRTREGIAHDLGTAVNVQAMVFGNRDHNSATGVGFTRDPATGAAQPYGDFLINAQGEDVVAGIRRTEPLAAMAQRFPEAYEQLLGFFARLEAHYRDLIDTEFTIEQGRLWMLQTRVGKRTGRAALRIAVEMTTDAAIRLTRDEAVQRVRPEHLDAVLHPTFESAGAVLTTGLAASPGAAVGRVYFTADDALAAFERGEDVILVRSETSPEDVHGMEIAQGVLTSRGGLASHAAVVARGWGIPAVVGAEEVVVDGRHCTIAGEPLPEGTVVSIDGSTGEVTLGERATVAADPPPEFDTVLRWADEIRRGRLGVRANADTAADAALARRYGAEGIGLCRTEHQFLGDRLAVVRAVILAGSVQEEQAALDTLGALQEADFEALLEAMDGLPVTVRLLDPPLHEFLPSTEEILRAEAGDPPPDEATSALFAAARQWQEQNPMLGTRGVRLGILRPSLYRMQVRSLVRAARRRLLAGGDPRVAVMIPLVVSDRELALVRSWIEDEIGTSLTVPIGTSLTVPIGTMIETPRAALRAESIARHADFFSFGTNDLTQLTFGFSRDDVESRIMPIYLAEGLLAHNPFETIDADGVGELVALGVARGRRGNPQLEVGVCGEHGGDPTSIAHFAAAGVDYVSCSPYRVPIARLAAAHAVLEGRAVAGEARAGGGDPSGECLP